MSGKIVKVSGPLVVATGLEDANMADVVRVGEQRLIGEILTMNGDSASIQVYEETSGLGPGAAVESTGSPLSVELGPGIIENIYDGIQRPLEVIMKQTGKNTLERGVEVPALDREKLWDFVPVAKPGDKVTGGDILGTVQETAVVLHKIMVPPRLSGTVESIQAGKFNVTQTVAVLKKDDGSKVELTMTQKWPVRVGRPYKHKYPPKAPLLSGQRIVDTLFPVAKGGTAAIPGPFGSGKTVMQHQLAKWSDVDIVIYIGCGERGNEMTDVLREFPELQDPRTGESLMKRTVLIANTSDMPVAAREASIYTGITIAEYFRDMGYHVAVIADSTSRWAEALREMSGRLEEMPGEEGYPAYSVLPPGPVLRAGRHGGVPGLRRRAPGLPDRRGRGLPSRRRPVRARQPGHHAHRQGVLGPGRLSGLPPPLPRHQLAELLFPVSGRLKPWFDEHLGKEFLQNRERAMNILQEEASLNEIVQLVGKDALSPNDQLTLETAKMLREDFLQQNSFMDIDTYSSYDRQEKLMAMILRVRQALPGRHCQGGRCLAPCSTSPPGSASAGPRACPTAEYPHESMTAIRKDMARADRRRSREGRGMSDDP